MGPIVNTLRPRQNGRHFPDDIFLCIFVNENTSISIKISLRFVATGPISNIPALVQIMAWRRSGDRPLSGTMMVSLLTHICVTGPQWVKESSFVQSMACRVRPEAISWPADDLVHCRIYASPGLNQRVRVGHLKQIIWLITTQYIYISVMELS